MVITYVKEVLWLLHMLRRVSMVITYVKGCRYRDINTYSNLQSIQCR